MSGNRLLTSIAVLAGLLALTVWQFNKREAEDARPPEVVAKLPKVKKDEVTELTVTSPGKPAVTVKKADGAWKVTAPINAAADKETIDTALSKLEELEAISVAATKPENYDRLEVTDAKGVRVVAKAGDKVVADVLIGSYLSGNTMVRETGAVNVATSKGSIKYAFDKELKEWRDRTIVEETADKITAATFKNANGAWSFVKEGDAWKQAPGEKAIPNFEPLKVTGFVSVLAGLKALDFAADGVTADAAGVGATPVVLATLTTSSDAGPGQILVRIGNKKDSTYYAAREGKEPIYTIAEYIGERLTSLATDKLGKDAKAAGPSNVIEVPPSGSNVINLPPGGPGSPGFAEAMKKLHGGGDPHGH